eukprot:TRINITY_DN41547_c0_g1_i1.p1 TRINITY_DN41547_c0_g1~~TRINITY_DN41547_c0_g1_i1.p1  ORF type:complete len:328 (-),score=50.65 TRINITY_DN41547_c0_g1_i1:70-1053(-)
MSLKRCSSSTVGLKRSLKPTEIFETEDDEHRIRRRLWTTDVPADSFDITVRRLDDAAEFPAIGIVLESSIANSESLSKCIDTGFFVSMMGGLFGASTVDIDDIDAPIAHTAGGEELRLTFDMEKGFGVIDGRGVSKMLDFKETIPINKYVVSVLLDETCSVEISENISYKRPCISFERMWEERQFTDVTVQCSDGEVLAHRSVLCMASPVFQSMLQGSMKEAMNAAFAIDDATSREVEDMLSFVYEGTLKETPATVLLPLAHRYQLDSLVDACCINILSMLSVNNVVEAVKCIRPLREQGNVSKFWDMLTEKISADLALTKVALAEL